MFLPKLSSGLFPWAKFTPGVEDWRGGHLDSVSSPLLIASSMRISRTTRPYTLLVKAHCTYHAGLDFLSDLRYLIR